MSVRRPVSLMLIALATSAVALRAQTPAAPHSVLPDRPDLATAGPIELDSAYISSAAGISVRPPVGGKTIRRAGVGDEVVRFVNDELKWSLVVSKITLAEPVPITASATADDPAARSGFADVIASQMPSDTPGKLLRSDLIPINGHDGAILASRYSDGAAKRLMQQAVIRRTDQLYYVLTYSTPLTPEAADLENDPAARRALAAFTAVVDSTSILDTEAIARDQVDRLIRTRALMVNWTPQKLQDVLVREQWLRLLKDGKDIGWTYIVEEPANDLPRASKKDLDTTKNPTGIRIGIRSRTVPEKGFVVDAESWFWVRYDRKQEIFRNQVVSRDGDKKPNFAVEHGTSVNRDRIVPVIVEDPGSVRPKIEKDKDERIELQIWSSSNMSALPPFTRDVPPYYLAQGLVHLLPRLVPLRQPRTYMFASYVPETRQVMTRYVDVLPMTGVTLGGQPYTAIPIQERAGLEGSVTTHYLTPDGRYIGSVNEENRITILATDAATLRSLWQGVQLERPQDVDDDKKQ